MFIQRFFFIVRPWGCFFARFFFGYLSVLSVFCGVLCFKFGSSPKLLLLCSHFVSNLVLVVSLNICPFPFIP